MNESSQDGTGEDGILATLVRDSVAEASLPADFVSRLASAVMAAKRRRRRRAVALGVAALVLGFAACAGLSAGRGVCGEASPVVVRALPGAAAPLVAAPLAEAREGARRRRRRFFFFFRRESSETNDD